MNFDFAYNIVSLACESYQAVSGMLNNYEGRVIVLWGYGIIMGIVTSFAGFRSK